MTRAVLLARSYQAASVASQVAYLLLTAMALTVLAVGFMLRPVLAWEMRMLDRLEGRDT